MDREFIIYGHNSAKVVVALSEVKLRNLKPMEKAFQESDGGGMFIKVLSGGSKVWRLRYRLFGKQEKVS